VEHPLTFISKVLFLWWAISSNFDQCS